MTAGYLLLLVMVAAVGVLVGDITCAHRNRIGPYADDDPSSWRQFSSGQWR